MLYLITATPGSGKTLYIINKLKDVTDRKIYYHGIPELKLPWIKINDVVNYPDEIEDGSIVVIDEVSDHFPVRSPKQQEPLGIEFIRKHRHRGVDIYFITQHPALLDHSARRLVGNHIHLQRNFGFSRSIMYEHNKLMETNNWHDLQSAEKTTFKFPSECYDLYKSAEVHTVKRRFPKKLLLLIPLFIMVFGGIYLLYNTLFADKDHIDLNGRSISSSGTGIGSGSSSFFSPEHNGKSHIDWQNDFVPVIDGLPYTAPAYQKVAKIKVMPKISGCVSQEKLCYCYTQQATRINMSIDQCFTFLANRPFDPFKSQKKEDKKRFSKFANKSNSNNQQASNKSNLDTRAYYDGQTVWSNFNSL